MPPHGASVVPGTFTTAFMYPEQRLVLQVEKRVCSYAKYLTPAEQFHRSQITAAAPRREQPKSPKEQEDISLSQTEDWWRRDRGPEIPEALLAAPTDLVKQKIEHRLARNIAIQQKHKKAEQNVKEVNMIKRLQAKKQSKQKMLRTALAWARVEEREMEEEEKRRALDEQWAARLEKLQTREIEKDIRQRRVQLREKDARTKMHEFYPLLKIADKTGDVRPVWKHLEDYMQQQPRLQRPCSAPNLSRGSSKMRAEWSHSIESGELSL